MPEGNAAAQRVTANAKAFRDLGYETFFIGLSRNHEANGRILTFEGWEYINFQYPNNIIEWLKYLASIRRFIPYLKKHTDLVIAYNYPAFALEKLRRWCSKESIPLISDCTEWYEAKGNIIFRIIKGLDTSLRMTKVHPKLNGMITISDYLYNYYNGRMRNVVNIPPLVDLRMKKWNIGQNETKNNNSTLTKIIYAGSPGAGSKDRLDVILRVLSLLKKNESFIFSFTIIGLTIEQYLRTFHSELPDNLEGNVFFKGRLQHTDTLQEIMDADFNLFLRDKNLTNTAGFPTKLVESISCGTPVITNSSSNIKSFIVEGKNGFWVDDKSETTLMVGLKKALSSSKDEILNMKKWCLSSRAFHYQNYLGSFKDLLQNT